MGTINKKALIAVPLTACYFFSSVAFLNAQEVNFWKERQKSTLQLAMLPTPSFANPAFVNPMKPVGSSNHSVLPKSVAGRLPSRFVSAQAALLSALPVATGRVRNVALPVNNKGYKTVLHIQDVHMNAEAQENISRTVQSLLDQKKIDLVALEGTFGPIDLSQYRAMPDQNAVRKVADYYLKINRISGPVHAAFLTSSNLPPMAGVDDPAHYAANVAAYKTSEPLIERAKSDLTMYEQKLAVQKIAVFNPDLAAFDAKMNAYHNGTFALGAYARFLEETSTKLRSPPLPTNVEIFLKAYEAETTLNLSLVEADRSRLLSRLVPKLSKEESAELMNTGVAYRLGQIGNGEFYQYLRDLSDRNGVSLRNYKAFDAYVQYVLLSDGIDPDTLFSELTTLENDLGSALSLTNAERTLIAKSKWLSLAKKLLDFSLTPTEWSEYERLASASNNLDLSSFEAFYREAHARDAAMTANLLKEMDRTGAQTALLVTGGYHTPGVTKALTQAGIATLDFVPTITKLENASGSAYLSVFTQQKTPLENLFEGQKLFLGQNPVRVDGLGTVAQLHGPAVVNPKRTAAVETAAGGVELKLKPEPSTDVESVTYVKPLFFGKGSFRRLATRATAAAAAVFALLSLPSALFAMGNQTSIKPIHFSTLSAVGWGHFVAQVFSAIGFMAGLMAFFMWIGHITNKGDSHWINEQDRWRAVRRGLEITWVSGFLMVASGMTASSFLVGEPEFILEGVILAAEALQPWSLHISLTVGILSIVSLVLTTWRIRRLEGSNNKYRETLERLVEELGILAQLQGVESKVALNEVRRTINDLKDRLARLMLSYLGTQNGNPGSDLALIRINQSLKMDEEINTRFISHLYTSLGPPYTSPEHLENILRNLREFDDHIVLNPSILNRITDLIRYSEGRIRVAALATLESRTWITLRLALNESDVFKRGLSSALDNAYPSNDAAEPELAIQILALAGIVNTWVTGQIIAKAKASADQKVVDAAENAERFVISIQGEGSDVHRGILNPRKIVTGLLAFLSVLGAGAFAMAQPVIKEVGGAAKDLPLVEPGLTLSPGWFFGSLLVFMLIAVAVLGKIRGDQNEINELNRQLNDTRKEVSDRDSLITKLQLEIFQGFVLAMENGLDNRRDDELLNELEKALERVSDDFRILDILGTYFSSEKYNVDVCLRTLQVLSEKSWRWFDYKRASPSFVRSLRDAWELQAIGARSPEAALTILKVFKVAGHKTQEADDGTVAFLQGLSEGKNLEVFGADDQAKISAAAGEALISVKNPPVGILSVSEKAGFFLDSRITTGLVALAVLLVTNGASAAELSATVTSVAKETAFDLLGSFVHDPFFMVLTTVASVGIMVGLILKKQTKDSGAARGLLLFSTASLVMVAMQFTSLDASLALMIMSLMFAGIIYPDFAHHRESAAPSKFLAGVAAFSFAGYVYKYGFSAYMTDAFFQVGGVLTVFMLMFLSLTLSHRYEQTVSTREVNNYERLTVSFLSSAVVSFGLFAITQGAGQLFEAPFYLMLTGLALMALIVGTVGATTDNEKMIRFGRVLQGAAAVLFIMVGLQFSRDGHLVLAWLAGLPAALTALDRYRGMKPWQISFQKWLGALAITSFAFYFAIPTGIGFLNGWLQTPFYLGLFLIASLGLMGGKLLGSDPASAFQKWSQRMYGVSAILAANFALQYTGWFPQYFLVAVPFLYGMLFVGAFNETNRGSKEVPVVSKWLFALASISLVEIVHKVGFSESLVEFSKGIMAFPGAVAVMSLAVFLILFFNLTEHTQREKDSVERVWAVSGSVTVALITIFSAHKGLPFVSYLENPFYLFLGIVAILALPIGTIVKTNRQSPASGRGRIIQGISYVLLVMFAFQKASPEAHLVMGLLVGFIGFITLADRYRDMKPWQVSFQKWLLGLGVTSVVFFLGLGGRSETPKTEKPAVPADKKQAAPFKNNGAPRIFVRALGILLTAMALHFGAGDSSAAAVETPTATQQIVQVDSREEIAQTLARYYRTGKLDAAGVETLAPLGVVGVEGVANGAHAGMRSESKQDWAWILGRMSEILAATPASGRVSAERIAPLTVDLSMRLHMLNNNNEFTSSLAIPVPSSKDTARFKAAMAEVESLLTKPWFHGAIQIQSDPADREAIRKRLGKRVDLGDLNPGTITDGFLQLNALVSDLESNEAGRELLRTHVIAVPSGLNYDFNGLDKSLSFSYLKILGLGRLLDLGPVAVPAKVEDVFGLDHAARLYA